MPESPNLKSFMQQFPGTSLDEKKGNTALFNLCYDCDISVTPLTCMMTFLSRCLGPEDLSRPKDATDTGDAATDNERCIPIQCLFSKCSNL